MLQRNMRYIWTLVIVAGCSSDAKECARLQPGTYRVTMDERSGTCGSTEQIIRANPDNPTPFAEQGEGCEILDSSIGECTAGIAVRCVTDGITTEMTAYLETTATSATGTASVHASDSRGPLCSSTYDMRYQRLGD